MRRLIVGIVAGGLLSIGVVAAPAAAEPQVCQGEIISSSVQPTGLGPGRRAVATMFFGDHPTAVRDAEQAVRAFCGF
jgi:hypothetical protein